HPGNHQTVPDHDHIAILEQYRVVRKLQRLRPPDGWVGKDLCRRFERDHEQPVDRKQEEDGERRRGGITQAEFEPAPRSPGHRAISMRFNAQVTMTVRMAITRKAIAA